MVDTREDYADNPALELARDIRSTLDRLENAASAELADHDWDTYNSARRMAERLVDLLLDHPSPSTPPGASSVLDVSWEG